jgi:DNA-binding HxlR family transcriptional regulator
MEKLLLECQECQVEAHIKNALCPVFLTQRVMRGKWKIVIIYLLKDNVLRFSQIRKAIPKVTQAYLSCQLKELQAAGLIIRRSYDEVPPKVEYYLTDEGKSFIEVIDSMQTWGRNYIQTKLSK